MSTLNLYRSLSALLVMLSSFTIAFTNDLIPRQTAVPASSFAISEKASSAITTSIPPCCVIALASDGVLVNSWYTKRITQFTATVITTVLQYRDIVVTANSTTVYLPANSIFTGFGMYGVFYPETSVTALTEVPTDLVYEVALRTFHYGGTTVVRGTVASLDNEDLAITSPTPYAIYRSLQILTYAPAENDVTMTAPQTTYDRNLCGTSSSYAYWTYAAGSWKFQNNSVFLPPSATVESLQRSVLYGIDLEWTAIPLPAPLPNQSVWVDVDPAISSSLVANQTLRSMYPWITNCFTFGGSGEPTVHVAVDQLTTDLMSTLTIDGTLGAQRSPSPTPLPTTSLIATTTAHVGQTSLGLEVSTVATSSSAAIVVPSVDISRAPPVTSTFSSTTLPAQQVGPSAVAVDSTTLSVGGNPITTNGAIISLIDQSGSLAVVIDGTSTQAFPTGLTAGQGIVLGDKIVTMAPPVPTELIIGGVTLKSGEATVISGQTVSLAGTNLVIGSGDAKTTQDIGGIILNGLGASGSSSKSSTRYTGAAICIRPSVWLPFAGLLLALRHSI